jgi:hypothetical protein
MLLQHFLQVSFFLRGAPGLCFAQENLPHHFGAQDTTGMDLKTDKNQLVFMKTEKTGLIRFSRLTENQSIQFDFLKKSKIFKIKNPKKTRLHFKNSSQNRIQKFISFHPEKIEEVYLTV